MLEFLKKKWIEWLISISIVIITVILTNNFTVRREAKSDIMKQLNQKANVEYVNQQDNALKNYIDIQDQNTKDYIRVHAEESQKADEAMKARVMSIDRKLDILINLLNGK